MTDIQLKKHLKKLGMVIAVILIIIAGLAIFTLGNGKAELSIYANADSDLQALGISESEFTEYLSVAGYIKNSKTSLDMLNMSTTFIDTLCSAYEPEVMENGSKKYDINVINNVLKEMMGDYIKENNENNEYYTFDNDAKICTKIKEPLDIPYCTKIEKIEKNDNEIKVEYKLAEITSEQKAEFSESKRNNVKEVSIKATIMCNIDYEYSKYFISNIEVN